MSLADKLTIRFDAGRRIFHLAAAEKLVINNEASLNELCLAVNHSLGEYAAHDRCYLAMDITNIAIDTQLLEQYSQFIKALYDKYLFADGLVHHGYQITRVTAQLAYNRKLLPDPHLFRNRDAALAYLQNLMAQNQQKASAK